MAPRRRQLNLSLADSRLSALQARAEELGISPTTLATQFVARGLNDAPPESESADVSLSDLVTAVLGLASHVEELVKAHHNGTIRLLLAAGVPKDEVRRFATRRLYRGAPPEDAALRGNGEAEAANG
jgi:hypothetical protein